MGWNAMLTEKLLFSGLSSIPILIGLGLIYAGRRRRKMAAEMAATETTPIGDIEAGDAPVAVGGEARPVSGTASATMLGTDAVRVGTFVQRWMGGADDSSPWRAVYRNDDRVPWLIDDGTGQLTVDATRQGDIEIDTTRYVVDEGETPPDAVQRLIDTTDELSADPDTKRRYNEYAIEVGAEVYAYGEAVERADAPTDLVLTAEETPAQFALTDISQEYVTDKQSRGSILLYLFALVPLAIGCFFTATIWLA